MQMMKKDLPTIVDKARSNTILLCLVLLAFIAPAAMVIAIESQQTYQFFFYHPDSVQNNLSYLKSSMDSFFADTGIAVQFQPFAHLADFDSSIRTQKPAFQWVPEWYVEKYGEKLGLRPFLVTIHNGKSTYRKVLACNKRKRLDIADLSGRTLAMTSMGPDKEKILDRILFAPNNASSDRLSIVEVPKDSDALLALVLGQVDFALVSEDNLQELSRLSAAVKRNVVQLKKTKPISMPYMCYLEGAVNKEEVLKIKELFLRPDLKKSRMGVKEALQIDAWQPVSY